MEVTRSSAPKFSFVIGGLFIFPDRDAVACGMARVDWTSHDTLGGFSMARLPPRQLKSFRVGNPASGSLPKEAQTCLICHDKSSTSGKRDTVMAIMMPAS